MDTGAQLYVEMHCVFHTITSHLYVGVSFVVVHSTKLFHGDIRRQSNPITVLDRP
jgi:hypothetical protein